ncbi:hypothetical protein Tco_0137856, partial [Tanacetum coccineum]
YIAAFVTHFEMGDMSYALSQTDDGTIVIQGNLDDSQVDENTISIWPSLQP